MAVVNVKSTLISNYDAQPRILSNGYIAGANDTTGCGIVACGASDSAGSIYRIGFLPSGALLSDLSVMNDANTSGTSYKFGVAYSTQAGGALPVANSDVIFGSAITMASARATFTPVLYPSILNAGGSTANCNLRVWELLGLTVDPFVEYHLIMGVVTPGSAGGNVAVRFCWLR
jgi:hypothetical protein